MSTLKDHAIALIEESRGAPGEATIQRRVMTYLSRVDDETLLRIETLMYLGRDKDSRWDAKYNYLSRMDESRDIIVRTIASKTFARYLKEGLAALDEEGKNPDEL